MSAAAEQEKLAQDFHARMIGVHDAAKNECGYIATRFIQMVHEHGGVNCAKRLLASTSYPEGLTKLWELGRLDISMEALVLDEKWASLFEPEEIEAARKRLEQLGYFE